MRNPFLIIAVISLILFPGGCGPEDQKWKYIPYSKAVIQFNIINDPLPTHYFVNAFSHTLIPRDYYESDPIKIEKSGKYYCSIIVDRPSIATTNFGEETFNIFVYPEDTTLINVEFVAGGYEITFSGDSKEINTYYLEKKLEFKILNSYQRYNFHPNTSSELIEVKQKIDSFTNRQLSFLNNFKRIGKLSREFIDYEKSEIMYEGINHKMSAPYGPRFRLNNKDNYFNFLDSIDINPQGAAYSDSYLWFLNEYFEFRRSIKLNDNLAISDGVQELALQRIELSNKLLTGNNRYVYNLHNFCYIIPYHEDTKYIDSLAAALQIKNHQLLLKIAGTRDRNGLEIELLEQGNLISDFYTSDKNYALVSIRDFKDYILLLRFYTQQNESLKISSLVLSSIDNMYKENKNLKLLNICIDCETQLWLDSASNYSTNIINLIAEGNWNRELKHTYRITGDQKYVLLNEENLYVQMFETIPGNIQERIDSLLRNSKYHEIEIR